MKLTSTQLRKIISEEVSKVLNEINDDSLNHGDYALDGFADVEQVNKTLDALAAAEEAGRLDPALAELAALHANIKNNALSDGEDDEEAEKLALDGEERIFYRAGIERSQLFRDYMKNRM